MPDEPQIFNPDPRKNHILAALPSADYEHILPALELVDMPSRWIMSESGEHVNYLHFPTSGIVSMIYVLEDGSSSEVASVGNEGMVGISIFMGGESMPSITKVRSAGKAYRLSRHIMKKEFSMGGKLQNLALLYTQALIAQTSQTAACNQHHSLEQRLCRWLLMSVDRLHDTKVVTTQEMVATLLGVRRESITEIFSTLQKEGVIERGRGWLEIVDRANMEKRACECYSIMQEEYSRLIPSSSCTRVPTQA